MPDGSYFGGRYDDGILPEQEVRKGDAALDQDNELLDWPKFPATLGQPELLAEGITQHAKELESGQIEIRMVRDDWVLTTRWDRGAPWWSELEVRERGRLTKRAVMTACCDHYAPPNKRAESLLPKRHEPRCRLTPPTYVEEVDDSEKRSGSRRCRFGAAASPSERRLDRCSKLELPDDPRLIRGWTVAVTSDLLPGFRSYRASDRYPKQAVVNLYGSGLLETRNLERKGGFAGLVNHELRARGREITTQAEAEELARFVVALEMEPYGADELRIVSTPAFFGWVVQATYNETTPVLGFGDLMRVGSQTVENQIFAQVYPDCIHVGKAEELRVLGRN